MICERCKRNEAAKQTGDRWTAYHGPAEDVLKEIESESVDAIITDPPYAAGANGLLGRLQSSGTKYRTTGASKLPDIAGDAMLPEAWETMMRGVWSQAFRIAKQGAVVLSFCDWRSMPAMLGIIAAAGFHARSVAIWDKGRGSRPQKNGIRSQSELIVWATKGKPAERETPVYLDGVFRHSTRSAKKVHLTEKPLPLMHDLIRIAPPESIVLDMFQGSATTGLAAIAAGHRYIGVEASPEYHQIAVDRLAAAVVNDPDAAAVPSAA